VGTGFALGKHALAICDRCGLQYAYLQLKKEWTGFKTCPECYEPKHPQLEPKRNISDAIALRNPRPDQPRVIDVYSGAPGDSAFLSNGMQATPLNKPLVSAIMLGNVVVSTG
jgi:hypothetical protein